MKINLLKENLLKMGYEVSVFDTKEDATAPLPGDAPVHAAAVRGVHEEQGEGMRACLRK